MWTPQGVKHLPENQVFIIMLLKGKVHLNSMDSTWTPHGLHGLFMDSTWTLCGLYRDFRWTLYELCGVHEDFMWTMWSPWGVHGNLWGTVKYRLFPTLSEYSDSIHLIQWYHLDNIQWYVRLTIAYAK